MLLMGVIEGSRDTEREIHDYLKEFRMRGEWFHYDSNSRGRIMGIILYGWRDPPIVKNLGEDPFYWDVEEIPF